MIRPNARALGVRVASRMEQEIRAYPRVYRGFYALMGRSARLRVLAGGYKDRVRASAAEVVPAGRLRDIPDPLRPQRERAVAARLGLSGERACDC